MTKKFNIFDRKPREGEAFYQPCFSTSGGYMCIEWYQGYKEYCSSETILFKDWQSARAATKFLLKYIKNNPSKFSNLKTDHIGHIYILNAGPLDKPFHQQNPRVYSGIEYLRKMGLVYRTESEALEARKELKKALYYEVLKSNRGFVFTLRHPLEDVQFYFPDSYSGTVKTLYFDSDNPDHNNLLDRNLLFTDSATAEEVLQTWLDLPVLNNNSQLKED